MTNSDYHLTIKLLPPTGVKSYNSQLSVDGSTRIWIVESSDALSIVWSAKKPRRFTTRAVGRKNGKVIDLMTRLPVERQVS
jgi:hypothetical protein